MRVYASAEMTLTDANDGISVIGIDRYYMASSSSEGITVNSSGWKPDPQETNPISRYHWSYEVVKYSDGVETPTKPAIIGVYGRDGKDGVAGPKGADGQTTYTWVKYSANANGNEMTDEPTPLTQYIGIAVNKTTSTESNTPSDYTWSLFKGRDSDEVITVDTPSYPLVAEGTQQNGLVFPTIYGNTKHSVSVGEGRNLLRNTKLMTGLSYITENEYLGLKIAKTTVPSTGYLDTVSMTTINNPEGLTHTASFFAKASSNTTMICHWYSPNTTTSSLSSTGDSGSSIDGRSYVSVTTEWKRYWVTWTQTDTTTPKRIIIGRNNSPGVTLEIAGVKLEKGDIATDWTPAPEDTPQNLLSVGNEVELVSSVGRENLYSNSGSGNYLDNIFYANDINGFEKVQLFGKEWYRKINSNSMRLRQISLETYTTYTLSFDLYRDVSGSITVMNWDNGSYSHTQYNYEANKTTRINHIFTTRGIGYDIPHISSTVAGMYFSDFKIEKGDFGTPYSRSLSEVSYDTPTSTLYKTNLTLPQPLRSVGDVKDRLFRDSDGVWKIERKISEWIANGTEDWTIQSSDGYAGKRRFVRTLEDHKKVDNRTFLLSSYFVGTSYIFDNFGNMAFVSSNNQLYVYPSDESLSTVALWKEWLSNNPVVFQYEINSTIETLDKPLQDKLNSLPTYSPETWVYTINNKESFESGEITPQLTGVFKSLAWANRHKIDNSIAQDIQDINEATGKLRDFTDESFADGLIEISEAQAIAEHINALKSEHDDLINQYSQIYVDTLLVGSFKTNLLNTKINYESAYTNLTNSINNAIADNRTSSAEKSDVDSKFTAYINALKALTQRLNEGQASIANKAAENAAKEVADNVGNLYTRDKTGILSGKKVFTDVADLDGVAHVSMKGESYQDVGSGKNEFMHGRIDSNYVDRENIGEIEVLKPNKFEGRFYPMQGVANQRYTFTFRYKHDGSSFNTYIKFYYSDGTDDGTSQGALNSTSWATKTVTSKASKTVVGIGYFDSTEIVEWKEEELVETVNFTRETVSNNQLLPSESYISVAGRNGVKTYTVEYKYVNGSKTTETRNKTLVHEVTMIKEKYIQGTMSVEWKTDTRTQSIPFTRTTQNDANLSPSESYIKTAGKNGTITYTRERKWVNGVATNEYRNERETSRVNAVNEVYVQGTKNYDWVEENRTAPILFKKTTQNDSTIYPEESYMAVIGRDGFITYKLERKWVDGKSTSEVRNEVEISRVNAVDEVWVQGTKVPSAVQLNNVLLPSQISLHNATDIQVNGERKTTQTVDNLSKIELMQWAEGAGININAGSLVNNKDYTLAFEYEGRDDNLMKLHTTANLPFWDYKLYIDGELVSTRADAEVPGNVMPLGNRVKHTFMYQFNTKQTNPSASHVFMFRMNDLVYQGVSTVWLHNVGIYEGHVNPFEGTEQVNIKPLVSSLAMKTASIPSTTKRTIPAFEGKRTYHLVNDFGAKGDGVTDNFNALRNALLASRNEPINIIVPSGNFYYKGAANDRLEVHPDTSKGIRFIGLGNATLLPDHNRVDNVHEAYAMQIVFSDDALGFAMEGITIDGIKAPQDLYHTMPNAKGDEVPTLRGITLDNAKDIVFYNTTFKNIFGGYTIQVNRFENVDLSYITMDRVGGNAWTESFGSALYFGGHTTTANVNIDNVHATGYTDSRYPELRGWIGIVFENGSTQVVDSSKWLHDKNTYFNITNSSFLDYETGWHIETVAGNTYWNADNVSYRVKNYSVAAALWGEIKEASNRHTVHILPMKRNGTINGMYYTEKEASKNESGLNDFNMYNSIIETVDVNGFGTAYQIASYGDSVKSKYHNSTFVNVGNYLVLNGSAEFNNSEINLSLGNTNTDAQLTSGPFSKPGIQTVELNNTNINRGSVVMANNGSAPSAVRNTGYNPPPLTQPLGPATLDREN